MAFSRLLNSYQKNPWAQISPPVLPLDGVRLGIKLKACVLFCVCIIFLVRLSRLYLVLHVFLVLMQVISATTSELLFLFHFNSRVNARIAFHRKNAEMYQAYQCAKADLHNEEYCSWAEEPGASCEGVGPYNQDFLNNLTQFECNLEPAFPQRWEH